MQLSWLCHCVSLLVVASAQTPITDENIQDAVDACLAEDPVALNCPGTEYGSAAEWDTSSVTSFFQLFEARGGTDCSALADISALSNWVTSAVTNAVAGE
jgi:hypothetical protein